ncbi:hypothetical protein P775_14240 [Puniceibacterium antarcticum]|uniref:HK97 gp10 family phage protein n=2 Tax=Puniceibacterium antarcticum TaxID=1206336 RepID=A0A2G8RD74_9RHOB|nr:hypothetical protein P775_14240 [Puniceibacterium antarcticum]
MRLEGFAELEAELRKLSKGTGKGALRRALRKSAQPLADKMEAGAPKDEGELRDSIGVSTKLSARQRKLHRKAVRDDKASVEMFVGAGPLPQAHLTEFGTSNQAPQPFARPAWDSDQQDMLNRLKAELWAEIEKTVKRAEARAARAARGR